MGYKDKIVDKKIITLILLWSLPMILLVVLCKEARFEVENFCGDGPDVVLALLLLHPIFVEVCATLVVTIYALYYLITRKRHKIDTLSATKPLTVVVITLFICMLIDGKAIILFFTEFKFPFFPIDN